MLSTRKYPRRYLNWQISWFSCLHNLQSHNIIFANKLTVKRVNKYQHLHFVPFFFFRVFSSFFLLLFDSWNVISCLIPLKINRIAHFQFTSLNRLWKQTFILNCYYQISRSNRIRWCRLICQCVCAHPFCCYFFFFFISVVFLLWEKSSKISLIWLEWVQFI